MLVTAHILIPISRQKQLPAACSYFGFNLQSFGVVGKAWVVQLKYISSRLSRSFDVMSINSLGLKCLDLVSILFW